MVESSDRRNAHLAEIHTHNSLNSETRDMTVGSRTKAADEKSIDKVQKKVPRASNNQTNTGPTLD
jgi:hypothetical protein